MFDLPETNRDEPTFPEHLEFASGSFFDNVPAADTYVLAGVLHDWSDERAAEILRVVRAAARSGARLLVLESVISPGNEDPDGAKWLDLLMLVISGRERTAEEWRTLVEAGGFTVNRIENGLIEARCR